MNQKHYIQAFHFNTRLACYCGSKRQFGACCAGAGKRGEKPKLISVIPHFISRVQCDNFLRQTECKERSWLTVGDSSTSKADARIYKKDPMRVTERVHLGQQQKQAEAWFRHACQDHLPNALNPDWFEPPQMLSYGVGGKYAMHSDAENYCHESNRFYRFIDRDFSMLIYLNDDYRGGDLFFKGLNFHYQPQAGDLVIFPSNHIFSHESRPVIEGSKKALVSWGAFMGTARVSSPRQKLRVASKQHALSA
jgi:predicted 2-oxoglutarate/Fe(II)-dependent dioxygenase YbiX